MKARDENLLIIYASVFAFGVITYMKIKQQNNTVEEVRQLNKDTWVF